MSAPNMHRFLCALPPALRQQWAAAMRYLVAPHGMLATQLFPLGEFKGGPPFALNVPEVTALLQDANFECVSCNAIPAELSHKSREVRELRIRMRLSLRCHPLMR